MQCPTRTHDASLRPNDRAPIGTSLNALSERPEHTRADACEVGGGIAHVHFEWIARPRYQAACARPDLVGRRAQGRTIASALFESRRRYRFVDGLPEQLADTIR